MSQTIRVAPVLPQHRSSVESIVRETGAFSAEEQRIALELFDAEDDYEFVGAFRDEELVGYACFGPTPSTDRTFDLYWIAVHPSAQGMGAGAALIGEVERQLGDRKARMMVIETSSRDDYLPTRRFYQRQGYMEAARLRDFYAPGDDRVVYTKRIAPESSAPRTPSSPSPSPLPRTA